MSLCLPTTRSTISSNLLSKSGSRAASFRFTCAFFSSYSLDLASLISSAEREGKDREDEGFGEQRNHQISGGDTIWQLWRMSDGTVPWVSSELLANIGYNFPHLSHHRRTSMHQWRRWGDREGQHRDSMLTAFLWRGVEKSCSLSVSLWLSYPSPCPFLCLCHCSLQ